jgi:hypothetical protein
MSQITIVNVEVTTPAGKKYQMAEVVYKQEYNGKQDVKTKKVMSFANPAVFATVKDAKSGEQYELTQVKENEYWQWTNLVKIDGNTSAAPSAPASSTSRQAASYSGRDFETKEERADRQRLIVRQSSLSNAINILTPGSKSALDTKAVLALADELVAWVTQAPSLIEMQNDLNDNIPY